jgi:Ca-activated chloride channel family protein
VKNGIAIDAWVKAIDVTGTLPPVSVRTYQDTGFVYLPPGTYDLEVRPLQGSDVNMISIPGLQSFDDRIVHQDISFDGGKVGITTTNNGANWDCMVKLLDANNKVAASVRTYTEPKEVEVNPGIYKATIQALAMEGMQTYTEIDKVEVTAAGITPIAHDFATGTAFIDARADGKPIDSVVTINEAVSGKNVAGGRTYNRGKEFLLNPGRYTVKVAPLGDYKDRAPQTFEVEVKKGERTEDAVVF